LGQSLKKYHHFRSYRIKVPKKDSLSLSLCIQGHNYPIHINDINLTGLSFGLNNETLKELTDKIKLEVGAEIELCLDHRRFFKHKKMLTKSQIIRKFTLPTEDDYHFFGVNFDQSSATEMREFIEYYLQYYDHKKLKKYLIESSINEHQSNEFEHIEFLSLFRELINDYFVKEGDKTEKEIWEETKEKLVSVLPYQDVLIWAVNPDNGELRSWPEYQTDDSNDILNTVRNTEAPLHFKTVMPDGIVNKLKHPASSSYPLFYTRNHNEKIFYGIIQFVYRQKQYSNEDEILTSLLTDIIAKKLEPIIVPDYGKAMLFARHSIKHYTLGHSHYSKWLEETIHREANTLMPFTLLGEAYSGQDEIYTYFKQHYTFKNKEVFVIDLEKSESFSLLNEQALKNGQGIYVLRNASELSWENQDKLLKGLERIKGKLIFEYSYSIENSQDIHPRLRKLMTDNVVQLRPLRQRQDELPFMARSILLEFCRKHQYPTKILSKKAHQYLRENPPANTLELRNLLISWLNAQVNDQIIGPVSIQAVKDGNQIRQLLNHGLSLEEQIKLLKLSLWSFDKEGNYSH
jgi:hypothetical protein